MDIKHDGVEILCLPDGARCCADEEGKNPLNIDICPMGYEDCGGDCNYYTEK